MNTLTCDKCEKTFGSSYGLRRHINTVHAKKKDFPCNFPGCNIQFGQAATLRRHFSNVHEAIKPFKCELCQKEFGQHAGLEAHKRRVHEKIKNFRCEVCNKTFSQKAKMLSHKKVCLARDKIPQFSCKFCAKMYMNKKYLRIHERNFCQKVREASSLAHVEIAAVVNKTSSRSSSEYEAAEGLLLLQKIPSQTSQQQEIINNPSQDSS